MNSYVILCIIFCAGVWLYWFKLGGLSFWRLAAKFTDEASRFFETNQYWYIDAKPQNVDLAGPFFFYLSTRGKRCKLWCQADQVEATQAKFKEIISAMKDRR